MSVVPRNKRKMCIRTTVLLMCMFCLVQAGRFKKTGLRHLKHYERRNASNFGLWPSSFNLATKAIISTNATCGENGREEFCRMMEGVKGRCGICDNFGSDVGKRHTINFTIDGSNRWWQSPALFYGAEYEYITITIDLKQVYEVTDVIIKAANSPRPGTWILERSLNGKDYEPWQYFARSDRECFERFGIPSTKGKPHYFTDTEVICTSFYSKLTPMENGEIHTSLINGRPGVNETSPELLQFTKARYVRLRFMGLRGRVEPLPRWFLQDALREKKLYYTVRDISIIGHCVCNGHAENCRHNVASGHPECECAHHTCGPNCDRCCPMYNQRQWGPGSSRDAHHCLPCNCHGHATSCHYDENIDKAGLSMDINGNYQGGGVCNNCTGHTTGVNCEKCLPGYYRPYGNEARDDCMKCECSTPGSLGMCTQEGREAGKCHCLQGYEGERCDRCSQGYKGWPKCETCQCDSRGILEMTDCEGDCNCKEHVEGEFCDKCKSGYFGLRDDNPEGCSKCFCSGVTTLCQSALATPKTLTTLNDWFTTDSQITETTKPIWDNKGLFAIGSYEPNTESLYWLAPTPYLGNKLEYYGSYLKFKVHWVIMRGDTSGKPTTGPNVLIIGGNGARIAHGDDCYLTSNETFNIEMKENDWYHEKSKIPVTRKEFLSVLSNVSHILLRATFHTDQIESLLEEALLYTDEGLEEVEKCSCPSGYSGLSCESCAYGYVRITTNTSESYCGKCDCNGHSETCNPDTGECSCEHNTMGENCERCKPGYYGNPLRGRKDDCKKCACPLENDENNFSPSCQLDYQNEEGQEESYVCTQCPKGYTGDHCEICDDGYFGNPLEVGGTCKPCNCNGSPCDKITGQCLSCKGNTEGWRCEKCKTGYYGNALMSNCISCQCDPVGSLSKACDMETGQCECKERFTGRTCNKCEVGYGNVTGLCVACACNTTGSKSNICNQHTGLCECKKGVDGFHCDTCQNLHYGFSDEGCKACHCDKYGAKIQACDQKTGNCFCKPNYEGPKCDRCQPGFWKHKSVCIPCNCNYSGSLHLNCNTETGACPCKPGVQGQKCDTCQDKHYGNITIGCKPCEPCEEEGHICHPRTGKCVCPPLTRGFKCEQCIPNNWGHEPGIGCKPCGCSSTGSSKTQCDLISGRCTCKLGFEGEKCNKCSYGYYGYPNCRNCSCSVEGTRLEDCSHGICKCSEKGCRCKANVEGARCDRCKKGTFGLDSTHSKGCTECFCSNRGKTCTASNYIWDQVRTQTPRKVPPEECVNPIPNCWTLPSKFTGDLTQSYGGYLRVVSTPNKSFVYLNGNNVTLESVTDPRGDIKLTENFWKVKFDLHSLPDECVLGQLTRPCFMVVLQNVTRIQIEPRSSQSLTFDEILLDKTSNAAGLSLAKSVENCTCPKEYTSSSCQDPNEGYYRYYPKRNEPGFNYIDRALGIAVPCECNNRSNSCDKQTGHCLNCENFTTGFHCESCAQGYYKNPQGHCSPCLCPSKEQNFASNCTILSPKQFICTCKPGYSGSKCNQCDDEYWGNPQELTGSCKPCECNPYGSETLRCDKTTGRCQCKPGFTGEKCSKCTNPRQVIQGGVCIACDECTQILFHTLDDLSHDVDETLLLFKNGLGPPWSKLNQTMTHYKVLSGELGVLEKTKRIIKEADVETLAKKVRKMKKDLQDEENEINSQVPVITRLQTESANASNIVEMLENDILDVTKNIGKFGTSHVDVQEALREAKEILRDIAHISEETPKVSTYQDFFNRCNRFYEQISSTYVDNLNATGIRLGLEDLSRRTNKLKKELDRTHLNTKLVKSKNKRNLERINSLKSKINTINDNNSFINKNLTYQLDRINATKSLLEDLGNVSKALREIDLEEATEQLEEKDVSEIYGVLSKLQEHVKNLQEKIKTYKNIFNFTSEEWTKIDASGAYDNIVKGIQEAKNEAEAARDIAMQALEKAKPEDDDSIADKANLAKAFSDRIQRRIINLKNLTDDFRRTAEALEDLKHSILVNGKNNNQLNSFLTNILKNITEHSKKMDKLGQAKKNAKDVSSLVREIEQRLKDMNISVQYELTKTYQKYLQLLSNFEVANISDKITRTKNKLHDINVSLNLTAFDNVTKANGLFNGTKKNLDTVRNQIKHLNDIIKYANDRVEGVDYGVNIRNCQRFYNLKNDILRSVEITFKCDSCSLFSLTNSNNETIKIYYRNERIYVNWKNQEKNYASSGFISAKKIGSRIEIKTETSSDVSITDEEPFQIEQNYLLQVGNLTENSNEACLGKIRINDKTLGLWKFNRSEGNCSGCYRNTTNNDGLVNVFFNGKGYRNVSATDVLNFRPTQYTITFSFATFDSNSLMFVAQDKTNACSFIAVNIVNGYVVLTVRHVNGDKVTLKSKRQYNNGRFTRAEVSMNYNVGNEKQTYLLNILGSVDDKNITERTVRRKNVYKIKMSEVFVGGISSIFNTSCLPVNTVSFLGNLSVTTSTFQVKNQNSLSANIEPALENLEFHKAWFPGNGYLNLVSDTTPDSQITFVIQPNNSDYFVMNINDALDIKLQNSNLIFTLENEPTVQFEICGEYIFVTINKTGVSVNNIHKQLKTEDMFSGEIRFSLGKDDTESGLPPFVGGISNIFIDDSPFLIDAQTFESFKNVEIGRDIPEGIITNIECNKEMQNTERYSGVPEYQTEPQAFKFGDKPHSFVSLENIFVGNKFILEFQFRTFYPNGLLFISTSPNKHAPLYIVLEIRSGDVWLQVQGHRPKVMNVSHKVNDGTWHHVQVEQIRGKKKWRLIVKVDKKWKVKDRLPRNSFNGDLYLGGMPPHVTVHKKLKNELHPFRGCIRALKVNKNAQIVKNNNNVVYNNIGQCFQNVEEGAYFGGDAFAIYKREFKVDKFLELSFEFKTSEPNGILLSISNYGNSPALSVELQNGAVVMTIDMGNGVISQVTNSPHSHSSLANNEWHNITALYSSSELTVNVDGIRKSWVQSDDNSMMDEIEAPLYVGGLPSNAPSGTLKIKENFKGCIRKFKIEENIMDWTDMNELNNVQLNSCLA